MNILLVILVTAFVLIIAGGIVALAWGIAHAPEGHEEDSGFVIDRLAECDRRKAADAQQAAPLRRSPALTHAEPAWH